MKTEPTAPTGIVDSLQALGDGLLATLHDRVKLVSLEVQEEKLGLIGILFWAGAVILAAGLAITFVSLALVYALWGTSGLPVLLAVLATAYSCALVAAIVAFRRSLSRQPQPFAATLQELEADRTCIRNGN